MENGAESSSLFGSPRLGLQTKNTPNLSREEIITLSSPGGHKRTLSGGILSRFPFVRASADASDSNREGTKIDSPSHQPRSPQSPKSALASAFQQQKKTRTRKGSLRKTAILGTGKLRLEERERLPLGPRALTMPNVAALESKNQQDMSDLTDSVSPDEMPTPRQSYEKTSTSDTKDGDGIRHSAATSRSNVNGEYLPITSLVRKAAFSDSTTDEDDAVTYPRKSTLTNGSSLLKKQQSSSGSESYFPMDTSIQRRRSANRPKSPLASLVVEPANLPECWDYSETEWWGWVVLIVTWIVFVVGMGSCFDVWSWAWDVGETPYAPPELEDDPTLPIVGYYPALIILTTVMAWVWVVVAWVGMKYFRHAKISGEDM